MRCYEEKTGAKNIHTFLLVVITILLSSCGGDASSGSLSGSNTKQPLTLLVPLYAWPQPANPLDPFRQVAQASNASSIIVILNPNNGPITPPPLEFLSTINTLHSAGIRVIGYVATGFGMRAQSLILQDIQSWRAYQVDGIFFDETAQGIPSHYTPLCRAARQYFSLNILNPGAVISAAYLDPGNGCNVAIMFEDSEANWQTSVPPIPALSPGNLAMLAHTGVADPAVMQQDLQLAVQRGFGMVYVTDNTLPNPWASLPVYWSAEVNAARNLFVK